MILLSHSPNHSSNHSPSHSSIHSPSHSSNHPPSHSPNHSPNQSSNHSPSQSVIQPFLVISDSVTLCQEYASFPLHPTKNWDNDKWKWKKVAKFNIPAATPCLLASFLFLYCDHYTNYHLSLFSSTLDTGDDTPFITIVNGLTDIDDIEVKIPVEQAWRDIILSNVRAVSSKSSILLCLFISCTSCIWKPTKYACMGVC